MVMGMRHTVFGTRFTSLLMLIALLLAGSVGLVPAPARASTTFVVDTTADTITNGACSLRAAIEAVNTGAPHGSCPAGGAAGDTITFSPTTFPPGGSTTITLTTASGGALSLKQNVTITGPGVNALTITGNTAVQVFVVNSGVTATISGLTATAGYANAGNGGAISVQSAGNLTLTDSAVTNSHTTALGGGIFSDGSLTLRRVTVSGNHGIFAGGVGAGGSGTVTIDASAITGNQADNYGGGLGLFNSAPDATVTNTTIGGNTAAGTVAGGIFYQGRTLALTNVTVTGNSATGANNFAGGIYNGTTGLTINDSIVSGNTATSSPDITGSYNGANNLIGGNALLAPLALNAPGTTQTYALLPGSPAIDAGNNTTCTNADQRGVSRPQGATCDAGAYESRGFALGTLTGNTQIAVRNTTFATPLGLTVTATNGEPVAGGQVTFTITTGGGGAGATFGTATGCTVSMSNTVAVCPIGATGLVTSPPLTANGTLGAFTVTASATGAPSVTFSETVNPALALPVGPPRGTGPGTPYSQTFTASGGTGGYVYTLATGSSLPMGLTLDPATGTVSGTAPTTTGSYTFTLIVTDRSGAQFSRAYTITVGVPNATPAAAPTGVVSATAPATAPPTHPPGAGIGAGIGAGTPQPVRH